MSLKQLQVSQSSETATTLVLVNVAREKPALLRYLVWQT